MAATANEPYGEPNCKRAQGLHHRHGRGGRTARLNLLGGAQKIAGRGSGDDDQREWQIEKEDGDEGGDCHNPIEPPFDGPVGNTNQGLQHDGQHCRFDADE
jgi:hypothetical protein